MPSLPPWLADFLRDLTSSLARSTGRSRPSQHRPSQRGPRPTPKPTPRPQQGPRSQSTPKPAPVSPPDGELISPGQFGPDATVEIDPHRVGPVRMTYHPNHDGDPDPGEIVWTWVPFEENDGRGKDRPVLVVAAEPSGMVLAVQLTSRDHDGERDFVPIGAGSWDGEHRPSWVNIDRVLRVHPTGMRREAAALDETHFGRVEAALKTRYGWG